MGKKDITTLVGWDEVAKVARQFVLDIGYADCRTAGGYARPDDAEPAYYIHVEAHKELGATRKMPVEHLTVQIRLTGPHHKTLRPKLITAPSLDM